MLGPSLHMREKLEYPPWGCGMVFLTISEAKFFCCLENCVKSIFKNLAP